MMIRNMGTGPMAERRTAPHQAEDGETATAKGMLPAVILAGGRATRMGGGDKCLRPLAGRRVIDHVIARLSGQCAPLALSANGDPARFADLGLPVLTDPVAGFPGPLAGILAGLDWAAGLGAAHVVAVAADTPFFPRDLAARLWQGRGAAGLALAASPDTTGALRCHPTFGLWPVALRAELRDAIEAGTRKVAAFAGAHGAATVGFDATPFDPFFNLNRPEDLAEAERLAALIG